MMEKWKQRAGILLAIVLAGDGMIHLYWATGNSWPAPNFQTLSLDVLNANVSFGPEIVLPLAILLFSASIITLARVQILDMLSQRIPIIFLNLGIWGIASGLLLRSVAGLIWILGIASDPNTTFYWLNLFIYTPLCLILFLLAVLASRFQHSHSTVN